VRRLEVELRAFRRLATLSLLASVIATVGGLYALVVARAWLLGGLGLLLGVALLLLVQGLAIRATPGSENVLVFVTKRECSLCDEARLLLPGLTEGTPFRIEEVELEGNRFLRRHFRHDVPVLLWQGEVVARLRWEPTELRARLDAILAERNAPIGPQSP
jgi:hypothetical protein